MDIEIEIEQIDFEEPDLVINGVLHYFFQGGYHEYDKKDLTTMLMGYDEAFMNDCDFDVH